MSNKSISFTLNREVVERLMFLRKLAKKQDNIINIDVQKALLPVIEKLESKFRINDKAWMRQFPCPKCASGYLILKTQRNSNKKFYGCSNYPDCKQTKNVKEVGDN